MELLQKYKIYKDLLSEISTIINYNDELDEGIDYFPDQEWEIAGEDLNIFIGDDEYSYTISSLGAKGKDLYKGEKDGLVFVLAYPQELWDNVSIFILKKENELS